MNSSSENYKPRRIWSALALLLTALAGAAYLYVTGHAGLPKAAAPEAGKNSASQAHGEPAKPLKPLSDEQLERMIAQAASQTQREPKNPSAWAMLAHSNEMLGQFAEAAKAYAQLAALLPKDAQVLADYADALAVFNGRSFKGEPRALLKRALNIDARNAKALVLAGYASIEEQNYPQAIAYLEQARAVSTDPAFLRQVDASIAQAKKLSGNSPEAPVATDGKGPKPEMTEASK